MRSSTTAERGTSSSIDWMFGDQGITLETNSTLRSAEERNRAIAALLGASAGGDQRAFADLYAESSGQLFAVILRMLRQRDRAEDVLQEVFVKIWHSAGSYQATLGTPMAWMVAIARNRAIDQLRKEGRAPRAAELPDRQAWADPDPGPLDLTLAQESFRALELCLDGLEEKQRSAILLAYLEGYTHQEIAERLKSPLGTIKSWIRRGQQFLKGCLGHD